MSTDTRERMLDAAALLLQRQGYHATGLQQLLAAGELPRGSLYFHFPGGKEQLACEAVARAGARLGEALEQIAAAAPRLEQALHGIVRFLGTQLAASDFSDGCPIASVAGEVASTSPPIRAACSAVYLDWTRLLAERLIAEGRTPDQAEPLAIALLSMIEGALLLARTHRSLAPLEAIAAALPSLLAVRA